MARVGSEAWYESKGNGGKGESHPVHSDEVRMASWDTIRVAGCPVLPRVAHLTSVNA